jgi:hypothetical protein
MFSKTDTTILKGIAILFMLFLHLFNADSVYNYTFYLQIHDIPLVHVLTRATYPVPFYLFLSGYGLYISNSRSFRKNGKRILKLYVHYWITLFVFVSIGAYVVGTNKYPGDISNIISNVLGYQTTYNSEVWFLLPYSILAIMSPFLFKLMDNVRPLVLLLLTGTIYVCMYMLIHYFGSSYLYLHPFVILPILCLELQFAFTLGYLSAKYINIFGVKQYLVSKHISGSCIVGALLLLVLIKTFIDTNIFDGFYATIFILLFVLIDRPSWLDKLLFEMGKRSTSMWLVHSYFCYHIFSKFIYSFQYPLLIFIVLLALSYISAVVLDYLNHVVQKSFRLL